MVSKQSQLIPNENIRFCLYSKSVLSDSPFTQSSIGRSIIDPSRQQNYNVSGMNGIGIRDRHKVFNITHYWNQYACYVV